MYIISVSFDSELALIKAAELLALGDSPERLAERLGITRDLPMVKEGVAQSSFKQVINDLARLRQYIEIQNQIQEVKADKSIFRFLGANYKEKQLTKLREERKKLGSLIDAPKWFYQQPRVRLLSAIRDYALDGSQQGDAAWKEVEDGSLVFPIAAMFESADQSFAEILLPELEKPLKDVTARFLLEKFEGNRSIAFDFDTGAATYYSAAPSGGS